MIIGLVKETKTGEGRVALIPTDVKKLVDAGHTVLVEAKAGKRAGFSNYDYHEAGAKIDDETRFIWTSDMVVKVKEPLESEFKYFRRGLKLLSYLHLAAEPDLEATLKAIGVDYTPLEDVELNGRRPALDPMSIVAGRVAVNLAIGGLMTPKVGSGLLVGGVLGTRTGLGIVVGGGISGMAAAKEMLKHSMDVVVFDVKPEVIAEANRMQPRSGNIVGKNSRPGCIERALEQADIVIGAVLVPGTRAPIVITTDMVNGMKKGSVLVDIAIDQGGCVEGIEYTNWDTPSYQWYDKTIFAIPNLPGAVPQTSSIALSRVVWPNVLELV